MELTFSNEYEYIPFFEGNRKSDFPGKVYLEYMTLADRDKYIKVNYEAVGAELKRVTSFDNPGILKASKIRLENWKVNGIEIKDVSGLLAVPALSGLAREIADYAAGKNVAPDLKN